MASHLLLSKDRACVKSEMSSFDSVRRWFVRSFETDLFDRVFWQVPLEGQVCYRTHGGQTSYAEKALRLGMC